ncbi:MAG: phosphotransferase [Nocardioidaceae bacterium]
MSWSPDPAWVAVPGRHGPATVGIWTHDDRVIKRVSPGEEEWAPAHVGYWRREAEVARNPFMVDGPGVFPTGFHSVEEDAEGITIVSQYVEGTAPTSLQVVAALGRFARAPFTEAPWCARDVLATRLAMVENRGGWRALASTDLGPLSQIVWQLRGQLMDRLAQAPQGRMHGDATPANFLAQRDGGVVAIDWQCFGVGPVGSDLGYWALSAREDFGVLLDVYAGDHPWRSKIEDVARIMIAFTILSRADLALGQLEHAGVDEGAVPQHPRVAPHLRALQRHLACIESLLD